jgi:dienelactone hydrolase
MIPIYAYTGLLFAFTVKNLRFTVNSNRKSIIKDRPLLRVARGTLNLLLLVLISMPPLLVPVFKLPLPTGPYAVGIEYDYLVDRDRPEPPTSGPAGFQEISVQIRYPAEISTTDRPIKYWEKASERSRIISKFWGGLPSFLFNHFSLIRTHSYLNARLARAEQAFPILIFNHGFLGLPSLNTVLTEELASHGFIVFSIGHSDSTPFFIRPDGSIKAFDPNNEDLRVRMQENDDPEVREIAERLMQSRDTEEQETRLRQFLAKNPRNQQSLFRWVRDISFAMDEMEKLNGGSGFFSGKLDLDRIGVFGVSFGGAASSQACVQEQRCKAAISIDCPQFGDFLDREVNQPIMFMGSEQYKGMNDIFLRTKDNPQYSVMIKKSTHQNLSDVSIWGKLFKMQMLGKIDGQRCLHVQNSYILAFFKKYLESTDNGLLDGPSPEYPEVEFMSRNTDEIQR